MANNDEFLNNLDDFFSKKMKQNNPYSTDEGFSSFKREYVVSARDGDYKGSVDEMEQQIDYMVTLENRIKELTVENTNLNRLNERLINKIEEIIDEMSTTHRVENEKLSGPTRSEKIMEFAKSIFSKILKWFNE